MWRKKIFSQTCEEPFEANASSECDDWESIGITDDSNDWALVLLLRSDENWFLTKNPRQWAWKSVVECLNFWNQFFCWKHLQFFCIQFAAQFS